VNQETIKLYLQAITALNRLRALATIDSHQDTADHLHCLRKGISRAYEGHLAAIAQELSELKETEQ